MGVEAGDLLGLGPQDTALCGTVYHPDSAYRHKITRVSAARAAVLFRRSSTTDTGVAQKVGQGKRRIWTMTYRTGCLKFGWIPRREPKWAHVLWHGKYQMSSRACRVSDARLSMIECRMRVNAPRRHARWTDVAASDGLE